MKTLVLLIALNFYGTPQGYQVPGTCCNGGGHGHDPAQFAEMNREFEAGLLRQAEATEIRAEDLELDETLEEVELGFDTSAYLPAGFDAYKDKIADHDVPALIEVDEAIELGFDTSAYLPGGFDASSGMDRNPEDKRRDSESRETAHVDFSYLDFATLERELFCSAIPVECLVAEMPGAFPGLTNLDISSLGLEEVEEEIELGFDTAPYLPQGFDPYQGMELAGNH